MSSGHYIDGGWRSPAVPGDTISVINPATGEVAGFVPSGNAADVEVAVRAARGALPAWSSRRPAERAELVARVGEVIRGRVGEMAGTLTSEVGCPVSFSATVQVGLPLATLASMPQVVDDVVRDQAVGHSTVVREPVGVVAAITPWNYPVHQIIAKVAPALTAGCTVVLKPSEVAPLNAAILADALAEAGLPDGVVNVVFGRGAEVGEPLASHPDVDAVTFTGSTATGRRVGELAARAVKRTHLELGGKSPSVVLDDADFERAVGDVLAKAFVNSGQTCTALSRLIVPRARVAEVEDMVRAVIANHPLVDPADETDGVRPVVFGEKLEHIPFTFAVGPVVSDAQRQRVQGHLTRGLDEGARLVVGGAEPPERFRHGYYVEPTVLSDTRPDMSVIQEEIFGPVLCIQAYDGDDDAVRLANGTPYGLCAAVWSADGDRALSIAHRIQAGQVDINGARFNPLAPFGGYKQSGLGRELGRWGLEAFLETKSMQLPVT